jgi:hypothetical protein
MSKALGTINSPTRKIILFLGRRYYGKKIYVLTENN